MSEMVERLFDRAAARDLGLRVTVEDIKLLLAAMREPTEAMNDAGYDALEFWGRSEAKVEDIWRAMIDAALK